MSEETPRFPKPWDLDPDSWFAGRCGNVDVWIDCYDFEDGGNVRIVLREMRTDDWVGNEWERTPQHIRDWIEARPEILMRAQLMGWTL